MKAIVVQPGERDSIHMRDVPDPALRPDQVRVRVIRVGLCGTDGEINQGLFGRAPEGSSYLILGHENFGVVEEVGKKVRRWKRGDFVVSTVRRPCGICRNCKHGDQDFCTSGQYTERGIVKRHGYMSQYYVEDPQYMIKIPPSVHKIGVLLEPLSIVEKGIDQAFRLQQRMLWKPKTALILGAGPVGLLAAAVLGVRGLRTLIAGRDPEGDVRAQLAKQLNAEYISVEKTPLNELTKQMGPLDFILEATGSSTVVFAAMQMLPPTGILCLLSVTGGYKTQPVPTDQINQDLVLRNNVVFGSVSAHPRHFQLGAKDFVKIERHCPGALEKMITHRLSWEQHRQWFNERGVGIKTTLEIGS
jgi:threonine dehydrogenase-like Zn-dependent dehydrogenase